VRLLRRVAYGVALSAALTFTVSAQDAGAGPGDSQPLTVFPHSDSPFWLSGQVNVIFQAHPSFRALYSGPNSLLSSSESATSIVTTLFTGVSVGRRTDVLLDLESAGGRGISDALGLAGFTNLDVVRNPTLGASPYVARVMVHQIVPLGRDEISSPRGPLSLAREVPVRRLEWRVGKFGTADFFDLNSVGSDSHLQFTNWTIDNNGAYDYAADTRGYTLGAIVEYHDRNWALRFGEMLMPKVANGIKLDWDLTRARAENVEVEWHPTVARRPMTIRALAYVNHANMGDYREAVERADAGVDPVPTIENTRAQGRIKYGFGLNAEQQVNDTWRACFRAGWNEPHHESFAYTEVNNTFEVGADAACAAWGRPID